MRTFLFIVVLCFVLPARSSYYYAAAAPNGPTPIAWWKLNDGSGTTAADDSGNGNTGTLTGTPAWGTGPNSNGDLIFDGTDDYATIANESNFDFERTQPFSITFWIKVDAGASANRVIAEKTSTFGNQHGYVVFADTDNQRIRFLFIETTGGAIQVVGNAGDVIAGNWYFVACTYDGSSTGAGLKVYVNAGTAVSGSGTIATSILNDSDFSIGKPSLAGRFWGELDDVRVYNVELTSVEVGALNSGGAQ